ncbi:hypothetical protein E0Z10_g9126 [Xylaria hypoxylon]|uniref:2EXR domain-containing protein n=1 Tax=Xylaria hypoxylon TaxID=37992 RepID=A0A4Z0YK69_9PEZI|nr:hypothetical protein E0Z10_g9126 [Xylaria hypoxylon]
MADHPRIEIDPLAPPPPRIIGTIDDAPRRRPSTATPRPRGVHTKHLTELERFRVRTLYYDAIMSKGRIRKITGYSASQIQTAVRATTAAVGKRAGRPKKPGTGGNKSSNAEPPTPSGSDTNAELIQQAHSYFEKEDAMTPGEDDDGDDDDDDGGESNDGGGDVPPDTPTRELALSAWASAVGLLPPTPIAASAQDQRRTFSDLPPEVRIHIWRCVLSMAPTQVAPSRSWALAVLPRHPWLELGMSPPDVKLENPPWAHYVDTRHVPATVLTRVNREARAVVLDRCTPILVSSAIRKSSSGSPPIIWIDRYSDVIHFCGERFRHELFEMAGRSACPKLYGLPKCVSAIKKTNAVTSSVKTQYTQNRSVMTFIWSQRSDGIENSAAKKIPGRNAIVITAIVFIDAVSRFAAAAISRLASAISRFMRASS